MAFFGSWVMVFDTSGQVRRDNDSRVLTMASVAIAKAHSASVRKLVAKRLSVKWRDGGLAGFKSAASIVVDQTLRVSVIHLVGISDDKWHAFWDEGKRQADLLKEVSRQSADFAGGNSASRLLHSR